MRRGTTPINTFTTPISLIGATVFVDYEQDRQIVIEKTGEDLTVTDTEVTLELTQEDTLRLCHGNVFIQIRAVFPDGTALASNIIQTTAERIIKDGVIHAV